MLSAECFVVPASRRRVCVRTADLYSCGGARLRRRHLHGLVLGQALEDLVADVRELLLVDGSSCPAASVT